MLPDATAIEVARPFGSALRCHAEGDEPLVEFPGEDLTPIGALIIGREVAAIEAAAEVDLAELLAPVGREPGGGTACDGPARSRVAPIFARVFTVDVVAARQRMPRLLSTLVGIAPAIETGSVGLAGEALAALGTGRRSAPLGNTVTKEVPRAGDALINGAAVVDALAK
jgi:hypothetical protein